MSQTHTSRKRRSALAIAVQFALFSCGAHAVEEPARFPSYEDGLLIWADLLEPGKFERVHVGIDRLDEVARLEAAAFCKLHPDKCAFKEVRKRIVAGEPGKQSEGTILDLVIAWTYPDSPPSEQILSSTLNLVRSCPDGAVLVNDEGAVFENRHTFRTPVACIPSNLRPQRGDLGTPSESGANQCPIGNAPTVGNPINPLTMSKIETVVDYDDPAGSGLRFVRTYHSGAFSLISDRARYHKRYPEPAHLGARWRHTWDRVLVQRPDYDGATRSYTSAIILIGEDGKEVRFRHQGGGYVADAGERGHLRDHPEGGWVYTWPDRTEERYDAEGRLVARTDPNGRAIMLAYDTVPAEDGRELNVLVSIRDAQGRELRLRYDDRGRVNRLDTPDGGQVRYDYATVSHDLDFDLIQASYPDGRQVRYLYDEAAMGGKPDHKLTGIVDGDGVRFATFTYDSFNRATRSAHGEDLEWTAVKTGRVNEVIVSQKDARHREAWTGLHTEGQFRLSVREEYVRNKYVTRAFDYLDNGTVASQTDYLGVPTTYRYDEARQLEIECTEAAGTSVGRTVKTTWHSTFDKPIRIDSGAHWTTFDYDAHGNLVELREGGLADAADASASPWPEERVTRYSYDTAGRVLTVDGPLDGTDDTTRYSYRASDAPGCATGTATCTWRQGDLHTLTNTLGQVATVLAYDGAGRVLASTDANGVRTDRQYDAAGRLTETAVRARRDGAPSAEDRITRVTYNANGAVDTITDPDGATLTHTYDAAHRLIARVDALANRQTIAPDDQGLVGKETYTRADGTQDRHREYTYDTRGVLERMKDGDGETIDFLADANGRSIGRKGSTTQVALTRDARGRVSRVTEGTSPTTAQTDLSYDGLDQVKTVVDPKGLSTAYLRNGLGDLLWQRSPDTGDTQFEHDTAGQPVTETPADQRKVERRFDALGRVTALTYSDGKQTVFTYDTAPSDCELSADFAVGRLGTVTDRDGGTSRFCYDFAGRVVHKTQVTQGVRLDLSYRYTPAGRLAGITYPDGRQLTYTRDAAGNITGTTLGAQPLVTGVRHDALGRPLGWTAGVRAVELAYNSQGAVARVSDGRTDGLDLRLTYLNGNVDSLTSGSHVVTVGNDALARVTSAGPTSGARHNYTYDTTGNRLTWRTLLTIRPYSYAKGTHHLILAGNTVREYDTTGNTTRIGERAFVYDASGRMSQAKVNGVVEMNYAYSPFGQQVAHYIAGQTTVSLHDEAGHWLGDYDGVGRPIRQMVWLDDRPMVALDGDAIRDVQSDRLGTPRVVVDRATDKVIWNWALTGDAFGSEAPNEDADGNGSTYVFDMRLPGQRYDAVTELFQNGWRDYDPASGRYIQSDPIGLAGGISTYAYVGSNPYGRVDPTGLRADTDLCTGLTAQGCMQVGLANTPDYTSVNVSWYRFSAGLSISSDTVYFNYSVARTFNESAGTSPSSWKSLFKPSISADIGFINSSVGAKCATPADVRARRDLTNQFLSGYSTSGGAYYGAGASEVYSPGVGTATQIGVGMGVVGTPGSVGQPLFKFRTLGD